jgi:hypothetical protein
MVMIESEVNLADLAETLASTVIGYKLMEFMLQVDEVYGDLQFTIELRDKLTAYIEEELK